MLPPRHPVARMAALLLERYPSTAEVLRRRYYRGLLKYYESDDFYVRLITLHCEVLPTRWFR